MTAVHLMILGFGLAFIAKIMQDQNRLPDRCPVKQGPFGVLLNICQLNRPSALNRTGQVWLGVGAVGLLMFVVAGIASL